MSTIASHSPQLLSLNVKSALASILKILVDFDHPTNNIKLTELAVELLIIRNFEILKPYFDVSKVIENLIFMVFFSIFKGRNCNPSSITPIKQDVIVSESSIQSTVNKFDNAQVSGKEDSLKLFPGYLNSNTDRLSISPIGSQKNIQTLNSAQESRSVSLSTSSRSSFSSSWTDSLRLRNQKNTSDILNIDEQQKPNLTNLFKSAIIHILVVDPNSVIFKICQILSNPKTHTLELIFLIQLCYFILQKQPNILYYHVGPLVSAIFKSRTNLTFNTNSNFERIDSNSPKNNSNNVDRVIPVITKNSENININVETADETEFSKRHKNSKDTFFMFGLEIVNRYDEVLSICKHVEQSSLSSLRSQFFQMSYKFFTRLSENFTSASIISTHIPVSPISPSALKDSAIENTSNILSKYFAVLDSEGNVEIYNIIKNKCASCINLSSEEIFSIALNGEKYLAVFSKPSSKSSRGSVGSDRNSLYTSAEDDGSGSLKIYSLSRKTTLMKQLGISRFFTNQSQSPTPEVYDQSSMKSAIMNPTESFTSKFPETRSNIRVIKDPVKSMSVPSHFLEPLGIFFLYI
ncbi:hypothetical protein AYI68_g5160 [Smittium mucronatum]|uniref:Uncharacterized protein n=1 Tax=Smittium mucronatum TaxID=133383 RepID=A0A1R0GV23_9FUNG|nr:hypothetical protein AYI68_g5160 [Smittium mucronatum]